MSSARQRNAAATGHGTGRQPVSGGQPAARGTRTWLRAGLVLLTVLQAGQGAWQYFAPRSFYSGVPTVSADPPFNAHLLSDVGGLNLALAVVLAAAAWRLDRVLTRVALIAYLVYSGSHLAFHATDQVRLAAGPRALLLTGLAVLPVLAAALLLLTTRPGRARQAREPARPTVPERH